MLHLSLLVLATFWAWETLRYAAERYVSTVFAATRAIHPLLVAALPLYVLWPNWVDALGVAGAAGLLVALVDRFLAGSAPAPQYIQRPTRTPRNGGLPPLP